MKEFMKKALKLAKLGEGRVNPNPMVGAVIVKDGTIIGAGYHKGFGASHAEVEAINSLKQSAEGAEMYVTLEPCNHYGKTPPCTKAIIESGISKVYIATLDPNPSVAGNGAEHLRANGVDVHIGLMEAEAKKSNEVFFKYVVTKRPFVHLKMAMSLDGKIATYTGDSKWISSQESREEVHKLRNKYMGIMVGSNTVKEDDPELTSRISGGKNPVRIVCDSRLTISKNAKVFNDKADTLIATTLKTNEENMIVTSGKQVDLPELMVELGKRNIDSVLVEGGSELAFSMIETNLVDKVTFYIAPLLIGGKDAKSALTGKGVEWIKDTYKLNRLSTRVSGSDIVIEGYL